MKLYELGVYLVVILLLYAGFALWGRGDVFMSVGSCATAFAISTAYVYIVKIRPMAEAMKAFREITRQNGFVPVSDEHGRKHAAQLLRQFPGFDDVSLNIEHLCETEIEDCAQFIGKYGLTGQGMNFGFFLLAVFPPTKRPVVTHLDKALDRHRAFTPEDEFALTRLLHFWTESRS